MTDRATKTLLRAATIAVLSAAAAGGCRSQPSKTATLPRQVFGGDFVLVDQDDRPFHLHDLRGKAVLLFFGYTSCPDMCPIAMSRIAGALERLGPAAARVATVFVSVDPERDSPAVLKQYVSSFSTPLVALTGPRGAIARVATAYRAAYERVDTGSPNYLLNHTTAIFLVDPQGALRQYFPYNDKPAKLAAAIAAVLSEDEAAHDGRPRRAAAEQAGVTSVQARIDGITCPTCVPPIRASLHRRFDKAAIDIDEVTGTATLRFDEPQAFAAAAIRQAALAVRMRVVGLDVHACGRVEIAGTERWLAAGSSRFLVHGSLPSGQPVCVDGRLDGDQEPYTLDVSSFELQQGSGS